MSKIFVYRDKGGDVRAVPDMPGNPDVGWASGKEIAEKFSDGTGIAHVDGIAGGGYVIIDGYQFGYHKDDGIFYSDWDNLTGRGKGTGKRSIDNAPSWVKGKAKEFFRSLPFLAGELTK